MTGSQWPVSLHAISPTEPATNSFSPLKRTTKTSQASPQFCWRTERAETEKERSRNKQQGEIEVEGKEKKKG